MSVPILLVTGFLGAGKTTFINRLLHRDHGLRIAAVVNDFGAINIDAEVLAGSADGVVGLKNGCICCSLQGDLLRTLKSLLRRPAAPDLIVIEASGVADPAGIIEALLDPVIWREARLGAVVCVVDAPEVSDRSGDPLWQAQLRVADLACLSRTGEVPHAEVERIREKLSGQGKLHVFDMDGPLPLAVLLEDGRRAEVERGAPGQRLRDDRFEHVDWVHRGAVDFAGFQGLIGELSPSLLRAKGFLSFRCRDGRFLFQLVGRRATLARVEDKGAPECELVLIGERGNFDVEGIMNKLRSLAR